MSSPSNVQTQHCRDRSASPAGPPFSPITPVMLNATLAPAPNQPGQAPPSQSIARPAPVPISESENPDAIALRSAISVLQIQRQQSLRDLKTLQRQKEAAVANPESFAKDVVSGKIKSSSDRGPFDLSLKDKDGSDGQDEEMVDVDDDERRGRDHSQFENIPGPQNIVRCPPINWAKYHIVGQALDNLHNEQRLRPTAGEPERDLEPSRAPEHVIAAPYRPWEDKLPEPSMRTRSVAKKET
ncbi:hypothetical protein MMC20_001331 [Loxospora ochrophaea]|nr:hypothetical protein [Loxospora ochrophaea]